ncbi:MAG: RNA 3'-phosphate cyclase [Desulfovibrio sp.]|nr:RNA 3'-phosphate cyclase [Desulfovibrio sp.]
MGDMITIDGSIGEGGGQILRTALALSMALGLPFRMQNIRSRRSRPGLKRQHLTCVRAAQELCSATVEGDALNATDLTFAPGPLKPGSYHIAIGTGGSVTLVCQALLPPLLFADAPSQLSISGGTHVPYAPPFEFLSQTLAPWLERLGPSLKVRMERIGYMNVGGGCVHLDIAPGTRPKDFAPPSASPFRQAQAVIYGHNLPGEILERETGVLLQDAGEALNLTRNAVLWLNGSTACVEDCLPAEGTGNMVILTLHHGEQITVFGECGWRGRKAENVAGQACRRALEFLRSGTDAEIHLADQLLVPLALAGGGSFVAQRLSSHAATCCKVLELFTGKRVRLEQLQGKAARITVPPAKE